MLTKGKDACLSVSVRGVFGDDHRESVPKGNCVGFSFLSVLEGNWLEARVCKIRDLRVWGSRKVRCLYMKWTWFGHGL